MGRLVPRTPHEGYYDVASSCERRASNEPASSSSNVDGGASQSEALRPVASALPATVNVPSPSNADGPIFHSPGTGIQAGLLHEAESSSRQPICQAFAGAKSNVWKSGAVVHFPGTSAPAADISREIPPLGGLRQLGPTMARLSLVSNVGSKIFCALRELFTRDSELVESILLNIGRSDISFLPGAINDKVIGVMKDVLSPLVPSFTPARASQPCTVNTDLLDLWCQATKEPDPAPVQWLMHGAPAGILKPIVDDVVFPNYDPALDTAEVLADDLHTADNFCNYAGVEDDPDVRAEVKRLIEKEYVREFSSLYEAEKAVGGKIVLSKIGVIKKWRNGKWKMRMVINTKASGVSRATRKYQRALLPRSLDVVVDTLQLQHLNLLEDFELYYDSSEGIEYLIADFRDAFFLMANDPDERRFFAVEFRGKIIIFYRTTQGSRGAPLTWARLAALITRLTQSVTGVKVSRISTYVDDPIIVARGPRPYRRLIFAMVLALWSALKLPVAYDKAVLDSTVTWTSATFEPHKSGVTVRVKDSIVRETIELLERFLANNYILRKEMRTCVGKAMHIASLVATVRPFLNELYAALHSDKGSKASIWTKQVQPALVWLLTLLKEEGYILERKYELSSFLGQGKHVVLELDASPWGLGGVLIIDSSISSWFSCSLSPYECDLLGICVGSSTAQQIVEALAVLVALRCWKATWLHERVVLRVRSDSISALILCLKLKTSGAGTAIIAREMALDIASSEYSPQVVEHVPGIDNIIPDELSRRFQPEHKFVLPSQLSGVPEVKLPIRVEGYFRTISGKPATSHKPASKAPRLRSTLDCRCLVFTGCRRRRAAAVWANEAPQWRKLIKFAQLRSGPRFT